jgi:hypothetical protein
VHTRTPSLSPWVAAAVVALLWVALFEFNRVLFAYTEATPFANWVFLPAALRVISVLVLGVPGAWGLFVGAMLTNQALLATDVWLAVTLSGLSAWVPWIGVGLTCRCLRVPHDLAGLTLAQVALMAGACAALSATAHSGFFWAFMPDQAGWSGWIPLFVGDLVGTWLVLWIGQAWLQRGRSSG